MHFGQRPADRSDREWRDHLLEPDAQQRRRGRHLRRDLHRDRDGQPAVQRSLELFPTQRHGFQRRQRLPGGDAKRTAETVSFNIGADDMAFAYLDGQLVCDLGGVHGSTAGTCVSPFTIAAGDHSLEVFFVDINNVQSGLTFGVTTQGVTTNPVPEPVTLAVFGTALLGLGLAKRLQQR
jgi:hypothetical protein